MGKIIGIVCVDNKWNIGTNNDLLFHLKGDMKFFKEKTLNQTVCMGKNTFLSLPGSKPLKNRTNIVLCSEGHEYEGCICKHSFDEIIDLVEATKALDFYDDLYIIGGAMLYKSMLPYYDVVYVTKVNADGNGTVGFPNLDEISEFTITEKSDIMIEDGIEYQFITYERG